MPEPETPAVLSGFGVELKHVTFSYSGKAEDTVLHGIDLKLTEGSFTALVGPSGGGKSTVARLISRFWDVTGGEIQIGGVNIKNMPLAQLSDMVSFVTQDNFLFRCSLKENIRLGNPKASDAEVFQAARAAQCDEFIQKLPQGYDTPAGEAGKRLSGGEKQRIAIARMILKNAPIVILDEATAFTDLENEEKIQNSIGELIKGKTLLVRRTILLFLKTALFWPRENRSSYWTSVHCTIRCGRPISVPGIGLYLFRERRQSHMFRTIKRIIDWCGEFRGKLYIGFVFSFFSTWFAAMPVMVAAYTVGMLLEEARGGEEFDTRWIGRSLVIILILVFLRFLFDYLRAKFQETISYELVARDRLAVGDALKRVSLGYFQQVNTGNILNSITTGLHTLENMGIRMIDNFVGGYLNFLCIFLCLLVINPLVSVIALMGAGLSFIFLLLVSRRSTRNAPVAAKAGRDLTAATLEYARGLPVVKSFGQGGHVRGVPGQPGYLPENRVGLYTGQLSSSAGVKDVLRGFGGSFLLSWNDR